MLVCWERWEIVEGKGGVGMWRGGLGELGGWDGVGGTWRRA